MEFKKTKNINGETEIVQIPLFVNIKPFITTESLYETINAFHMRRRLKIDLNLYANNMENRDVLKLKLVNFTGKLDSNLQFTNVLSNQAAQAHDGILFLGFDKQLSNVINPQISLLQMGTSDFTIKDASNFDNVIQQDQTGIFAVVSYRETYLKGTDQMTFWRLDWAQTLYFNKADLVNYLDFYQSLPADTGNGETTSGGTYGITNRNDLQPAYQLWTDSPFSLVTMQFEISIIRKE